MYASEPKSKLRRYTDPNAARRSELMHTTNKLLQFVPEKERRRLLSISDEIDLQPRQVLHHWRLPMDKVYFIESGLVSVSAKVDEDRFVEVWLIGSEGLVGAPLVLAEEDQEPPHRRVVQVRGRARRIDAKAFCKTMRELPVLRSVVLHYINLVLLQTSQSGACNARHPVKQRLARWLLVARAALESDVVPLTHEVLSNLLGVRRASVTECLEVLETEGVIRNARGVVSIDDPNNLQRLSCNCFRLIDREYRRQMNLIQTSPQIGANGPNDMRL
jgi:CRP-like cAMP-binding protein